MFWGKWCNALCAAFFMFQTCLMFPLQSFAISHIMDLSNKQLLPFTLAQHFRNTHLRTVFCETVCQELSAPEAEETVWCTRLWGLWSRASQRVCYWWGGTRQPFTLVFSLSLLKQHKRLLIMQILIQFLLGLSLLWNYFSVYFLKI